MSNLIFSEATALNRSGYPGGEDIQRQQTQHLANIDKHTKPRRDTAARAG